MLENYQNIVRDGFDNLGKTAKIGGRWLFAQRANSNVRREAEDRRSRYERDQEEYFSGNNSL